MRIQAVGSITAAGAWLVESGDWTETITNPGTGDHSVALGAERGANGALRALLLSTVRATLVGSDIPTVGLEHTSDTAKRITTIDEGTGGAESAPADLATDLALCNLDGGGDGMPVLAAGSFDADGTITCQLGDLSAVAASGTGLKTVTLGRAHASSSCVLLVTPRGTLVPSGLVGVAANQTADADSKTITTVKEAGAGAASVLADHGCEFVLIGNSRRPSQLRLVACALLSGGAAPTYTWQSGHFADIERASEGIVDLTLGRGGWDTSECVVIASPQGEAVASGLRSVAVSHTSATVKRLTMLQEAAGGAASTVLDLSVGVAIFARG